MWRATLKSLLARKLRLALTALAIVLGVGFMAGTFVLTDTMNRRSTICSPRLGERATSSCGGLGVRARAERPGRGERERARSRPETSCPTIAAVPGVRSAEGYVHGYAQMVDPATGDAIGGVGPPTLGVELERDQHGVDVAAGRRRPDARRGRVDAGTAKKLRPHGRQTIRILFQGPPREFTIVGHRGVRRRRQPRRRDARALRHCRPRRTSSASRGEFDEIDVVADPGVSPRRAARGSPTCCRRASRPSPARRWPTSRPKQLKDALGFFRTALLVFAFIALFVGAFIIFNTFSIIVAQRTRELALLRALGASRRQVLTSVMVEAFLVGLVASALGVVAGIGIAIGLQGLLAGLRGSTCPARRSSCCRARWSSRSSSARSSRSSRRSFPARRAARVAPIQALQESADTARGRIAAVAGWSRGCSSPGLRRCRSLYGLFGSQSNAGALGRRSGGARRSSVSRSCRRCSPGRSRA